MDQICGTWTKYGLESKEVYAKKGTDRLNLTYQPYLMYGSEKSLNFHMESKC